MINCRSIAKGKGKGELIVSSEPISFLGGVNPDNGEIIDPNHELKGEIIKDKVLFILDYSNSMKENIDGTPKVNLMLDTMKQILPSINPETYIGLRVYGHRLGFTQYDACHASSLLVPIAQSNGNKIYTTMQKTNPRGMTPITYSLKKAVNSDLSNAKTVVTSMKSYYYDNDSSNNYVLILVSKLIIKIME